MHIYIHRPTYIHTHIHAHAHIHTYTHTHIHLDLPGGMVTFLTAPTVMPITPLSMPLMTSPDPSTKVKLLSLVCVYIYMYVCMCVKVCKYIGIQCRQGGG